jgi:hypothetical protein
MLLVTNEMTKERKFMRFHHIRLDQPAGYIIKVQGRLSRDFSDWFAGEVRCAIEAGEDGQALTVLTGVVLDQAALHGLLTQIRDIGLPLVLVALYQPIDELNDRADAGRFAETQQETEK